MNNIKIKFLFATHIYLYDDSLSIVRRCEQEKRYKGFCMNSMLKKSDNL